MRDHVCVGRLAPPSWLRSPLGLVVCKAWEITGAQFAFYLSPVSGPISLLEVDGASVLGRR